MILTREKEQKYKELTLFRSFYAENRIEGISKQRNMIAESAYISHPGSHNEFLDRVFDSLRGMRQSRFLGRWRQMDLEFYRYIFSKKSSNTGLFPL